MRGTPGMLCCESCCSIGGPNAEAALHESGRHRSFASCLAFWRNLVVGEPIGQDAESNLDEVD